jgi:hypothetical protein
VGKLCLLIGDCNEGTYVRLHKEKIVMNEKMIIVQRKKVQNHRFTLLFFVLLL